MCAIRFSELMKKAEPAGAPAKRTPEPIEPAKPAEPIEQPPDEPGLQLRDFLQKKPVAEIKLAAAKEPIAIESISTTPPVTAAQAEEKPEAAVKQEKVVTEEEEIVSELEGLVASMGISSEAPERKKLFEFYERGTQLIRDDTTKEKPGALWKEYYSLANDIAESIHDFSGAMEVEFAQGESDHIRHAIKTCVITMELSNSLGKQIKDRIEVGAMALLHGTGYLNQPEIDEEKADPSGNLVAQSTNLAHKIYAPEEVVRSISDFREYYDGSGVPKHLSGTQISIASQTVGLACRFELLFQYSRNCKKNVVENQQCPDPILAILKQRRTQFAPEVLKSLLLVNGFYSIGSIVELNNGALARVIAQNRGFPLRPLIEIVVDRSGNHPANRQVIDLHENISMAIMRTVTKEKK